MSLEYEVLTRIVKDTFSLPLRLQTLDFLSYLNDNSMEFKRLEGYWKNQFYWQVNYNNKCVCYILINGTGDESQFAPLTIWTNDSGSDVYEKALLRDELKESAWKNVDFCVHCGSCSGGRYRMLFGKGFDNVCRTEMRFTNPDKQEFEAVKELVKIRKLNIENGE